MYLIELQQISIKNSQKSAELAFYDGFSAKIGQNIGKFPYFHKIADISKSRQFNFLELGSYFNPEFGTEVSYTSYQLSIEGFLKIFTLATLSPILTQGKNWLFLGQNGG